MGSTQVAVRMSDELLERLDWLVARCNYDNRADAIRAALEELAGRERSREIGEQIADGYRRVPQTASELDGADRGGFSGLPDDDWAELR